MDGLNEQEWNILLSSIISGRVIPVVGEGIIKNAADAAPLVCSVAAQLAKEYGIEVKDREDVTLNEVVTQIVATREVPSGDLYKSINLFLSSNDFATPAHIKSLVSISHFSLFLTTTFDRTIENAIDAATFGGSPGKQASAFSIKSWPDLPDWKDNLGSCVYYLLGRTGVIPRSFAIWDADAIDFVLHLHDLLKDGKTLPFLNAALREYDLLFLGVNLTDWLARFFLRVARQDTPANDAEFREYVAERGCDVSQSFVSYCRSARRGTRILTCEPIPFVEELYGRWKKRCEEMPESPTTPRPTFRWPDKQMPKNAVFVSYAREDILAAQQIVDDLRKHGCVVWLDRERLEAGENWENTLEMQVKKYCSVFISVISRNTESRAGYCHRERKWAADRDADFGRDGDFYIPVTIDDIGKSDLKKEQLPGRPINVWSLPGGFATSEFAARIATLQHMQGGGV